MKVSRIIGLAAAVCLLSGWLLFTIYAVAQNTTPPSVDEVAPTIDADQTTELLAEQRAAQAVLAKANTALQAAQGSLAKGVATPDLVAEVQAELERTQSQYEAITEKLRDMLEKRPAESPPGFELKTEYRDQRTIRQVPVSQPDGSVTFEMQEIIQQVPVQVAVPRTATAPSPGALWRPNAPAKATSTFIPAVASVTEAPIHDEESQKFLTEEKSAAAEASKLQAQLKKVKSEQQRVELRGQLREKLAAIFDLQQKRRAHEVALVEERLEKLKETMNKRNSAKDSIVDRRLEVITGGVDELGWEETSTPPAAGTTMSFNYSPPAMNSSPVTAPYTQLIPSTPPLGPRVPLVAPPPTRAPPTSKRAVPVPAPAPAAALPSPSSVTPATPVLPITPALPAPAAPAAEAPPAAPAAPPAPAATPAPAAAPAAPVPPAAPPAPAATPT